MTRLRVLLAVWLVGGLACGGGGATDAGGDANVDSSVDANASTDATFDAPCTRVEARVGPEGGTLTHCDGAILTVPAGALSETSLVSIERLADPAAPAFPYVLAGPAFVFATERPFEADVDVAVPHDRGARMEMAVLVDGTWSIFEACDVAEGLIGQTLRTLGTFVALRDPNPYPDGTTGLGEGRIDFSFGDVDDAYEIDPSGYAIDEDPSAGRSLTLVFRRSETDALRQIDLRFTIDGEGVPHPVQVQHADTSVSEIWSADVLATPDDLAVTLTRDEDGTIEGTVEATLHLGEATRALTATFTARPEVYRYPPERLCGLPPEG